MCGGVQLDWQKGLVHDEPVAMAGLRFHCG